jgi:hypothetical protein
LLAPQNGKTHYYATRKSEYLLQRRCAERPLGVRFAHTKVGIRSSELPFGKGLVTFPMGDVLLCDMDATRAVFWPKNLCQKNLCHKNLESRYILL